MAGQGVCGDRERAGKNVAHDVGGEHGLAGGDGSYRFDEGFRVGVFEEEPVRPGSEGRFHGVGHVEGGEHDYFGRVGFGPDFLQGGHAVEFWHAHIHKHEVDGGVGHGVDCGLAVVDGGDDLQVRLGP